MLIVLIGEQTEFPKGSCTGGAKTASDSVMSAWGANFFSESRRGSAINGGSQIYHDTGADSKNLQ